MLEKLENDVLRRIYPTVGNQATNMTMKPPDIGDSTSQNVDSTTEHNQEQNMKVSQVSST